MNNLTRNPTLQSWLQTMVIILAFVATIITALIANERRHASTEEAVAILRQIVVTQDKRLGILEETAKGNRELIERTLRTEEGMQKLLEVTFERHKMEDAANFRKLGIR